MAQLKKLHRSTNSIWFSGVCGGVAEYFGWSPNILRFVIIAVIAISAGITTLGFLPVYVVLWLLMPRATPSSYN